MNMYNSISILVITYKHEKYISKCLDSILSQKEYGLKEIVICDDCSPDGNWSEIQRYASLFPSIIRPYKNEKNLGIYGNLQKLVSLRGNADLYYIMAGDDLLCDGWFKEAQRFIKENSIQVVDTATTIYFDYAVKRLTGEVGEAIGPRLINKGFDPFRLRVRGLLSNRSTLTTENVLKKYSEVDLTQGVFVAEELFDIQMLNNTDYFYYDPFIGSLYCVGLGVTVDAYKPEFHHMQVLRYSMLLKDYYFNWSDRQYLKYKIEYFKFWEKPSFKAFISSILFWILSTNFKFGIRLKWHVKSFGKMAFKLIKNK